jgi:hypothetical protein
MPDFEINAADAHVYDVTITDDGGAQTEHRVTVPESFLTDHGLAESQEPTLVRASIRYLLDRESPSSILAAFTLDDITRYFPAYSDEILTLL